MEPLIRRYDGNVAAGSVEIRRQRQAVFKFGAMPRETRRCSKPEAEANTMFFRLSLRDERASSPRLEAYRPRRGPQTVDTKACEDTELIRCLADQIRRRDDAAFKTKEARLTRSSGGHCCAAGGIGIAVSSLKNTELPPKQPR